MNHQKHRHHTPAYLSRVPFEQKLARFIPGTLEKEL